MVLVFWLAIGTAARPPSATEAALLPSTGWAPSRSRAVRPGPGPGPDGLPVRAPLVDRCQGQVVAGDRPAVAAERPGRRAVRASEIVVAERAGGPASTGRGAAVCSLRAPWRHPGRS